MGYTPEQKPFYERVCQKKYFFSSSAGANTWCGDALALVAGLLGPLAFSPYDAYPLAVISPALLFAVCRNLSARRAFWRGWLFGVGWFGAGVSWIYVAIHDFGYASVPLALALTATFVAFLGLFPALLTGGVTFWFPQENRAKYLLVWPAAWVMIEWFRGWFLTGFPWLNLGYSQIESPLRGLAPIFGVYGVSLAVAFSAGLIVAAWRWALRARLIALGGLGTLWASALLLSLVPWTMPVGKPLQVSLIQGNIPQAIKWQPEQIRSTLERYWQLTAKHWESDLIVWPESALTVLYHQVADGYLAALAAEARAYNTDLLIGLPVFHQETGKYYNSMLSLGSQQAFYYKRHLVPFGEYIPFEEYLRGLIHFFDLPMSSFSAGPKGQPLLQAAGYPVATSICYEDAFGEEIIAALPEANLLVNATNNAWYGDSLAPHQHLQISRMRALETGRDLARATTNGISAIVDAQGALLATTPQFQMAVLTGSVQPRAGATPYILWGNGAVLGLCLCLFAIGSYYQRSKGS
ncbi:apolipoprotein N-acyltransferase [Nitrosococcus watsonii]|uniref:Apolipoprotein N-acyltransferase n=1 Tax=Nitrosococcus watsoni (strain C-113) TaxID=105559 RepID=D8K9M0_NITWC|nr:apolipoprotein N-acyltransferase [Nitrosococcus watsonii]ADJ27309.1 apolipoprotein N-acyltransferase [Nitrosococcus watsonii C-113]